MFGSVEKAVSPQFGLSQEICNQCSIIVDTVALGKAIPGNLMIASGFWFFQHGSWPWAS